MEPRVGDMVDVPGGMYGTVKFIGEVEGKKGKFAGVQLAVEFAVRGKNSGDVDGKHYFRTTKPGSGIFLPVEKAIRKGPSTPLTASLANFNQGGRTPALPKPNFSQSIGPGARAASPALRPTLRRPSLQRPDSPLRKTPTAMAPPKLSTPGSRPSVGPGAKNKVGMGSRYGQTPMMRPSNFGTSRSASVTPSRTPLGPELSFDEDADFTPTPTPVHAKTIDHTVKDQEIRRLKQSLEERDGQLKEQAATLSEMEKSLSELQSLLPPDYDSLDQKRESQVEAADVVQMRNTVREKNEKIQMLIAEFDAHRADFRSTIDTLEMASTETERVYEKRVDELLQEVRELQDRGEDVENVAQQLKQLEELVQELEEGLEDARRGEAEARGEVEFLRGEVERGRSELKREKAKVIAAEREDTSDAGSNHGRSRELEAKEDEIRGLKAIIHSFSREPPGRATNGHVNGFGHHVDVEKSAQLEARLSELETLLGYKSSREEELERELDRLRSADAGAAGQHKRTNTVTSHRLSDRTIVPGDWRDRDQNGQPIPHPLETMHEADAQSTATDSSALWCEICETGGHDILTCTNMFANNNGQAPIIEPGSHEPPPADDNDDDDDATAEKSANGRDPPPPHIQGQGDGVRPLGEVASSYTPLHRSSPPPQATTQVPPMTALPPAAAPSSKQPNPMDQGMVAGKASGVIDADRWCALCERDGHESVDCPFEDAF